MESIAPLEKNLKASSFRILKGGFFHESFWRKGIKKAKGAWEIVNLEKGEKGTSWRGGGRRTSPRTAYWGDPRAYERKLLMLGERLLTPEGKKKKKGQYIAGGHNLHFMEGRES